MKKIFLVVLAATSLSSMAHASGLARIRCESDHAGIYLYHFGFAHTVDGVQLSVDGVITKPGNPPAIYGKDLYVDDGIYRFVLRNLFEREGASYPVPDFELQVKVFGNHYAFREKGQCVLY